MKIKLIGMITAIATLFTLQPAQAQSVTTKPNQIAPSISFGGGTSVFGVTSRFPLNSNFSLRPSVRFPAGGVVVGTSVTYDFNLDNTDARLEPYAGAGFDIYTGDNNNNGANFVGYAIGGADYALTDQFALKGSVAIPFRSGYDTTLTLGVGYKY